MGPEVYGVNGTAKAEKVCVLSNCACLESVLAEKAGMLRRCEGEESGADHAAAPEYATDSSRIGTDFDPGKARKLGHRTEGWNGTD